MISSTLYFYSVAFGTIINSRKCGVHFKKIYDELNCFYIIDNRVPILLKHATKRTSPWGFGMRSKYLKKYIELVKMYGECLALFICGNDGIATLSFSEMNSIIKLEDESAQKRISVSRKLKEMYFVTASDGKMETRISQSSLIEHLDRILGKDGT